MTELGDVDIPTQAKIGLEWATRPDAKIEHRVPFGFPFDCAEGFG
jgi:hypothetical protein